MTATSSADTTDIAATATATTTGTENSAPKGWRAHLPIHPAAELLPLMSEADLRELADDIEENRLLERIKIYRDPVLGDCVLDGRNRLDALVQLGADIPFHDQNPLYSLYFQRVGASRHERYDFDPYVYVISQNLKRRHLTQEDRVKFIIDIIAMKPEKSDRQIAEELGVDHKVIGRARAKGEDVGRVPHVEVRTDTKGRKQPAKKKHRDADNVTAKNRETDKRHAKGGLNACHLLADLWKEGLPSTIDPAVLTRDEVIQCLAYIEHGKRGIDRAKLRFEKRLAEIGAAS